MNNINSTIISFFKKNKWLLLLFFPLLIILIGILYFNATSPQPSNSTIISPTKIPENNTIDENNDQISSDISPFNNNGTRENDVLEETDLVGLQKKEALPDGTEKYSLKSPDQSHTNTLITKDEQVVFQKSVRPKNFGETVMNYTESYGDPEKTLDMESSLTPNARIYIYASRGFAFLADKQTNEVLIQYTFQPMTPDEFISKYKNELQ